MKNLKKSCVLFFSVLCFSVTIALANISEVIEDVKESIVVILLNTGEDLTNNSPSGTCTGFVFNEVGHILTNYHCVHKQSVLRLFYFDEDDWEEYDVEVVGIDPLADLAVVAVPRREKPVPYLKLAESIDQIKEGMKVFAVGHPMGLPWSVSSGIISSTKRYSRHPFIKAFQTDAALNQGNSGGPLLNMKGEVIGINSMIVSKNAQNAGLGIVIRADIIKESLKSMIAGKKVTRPAIGIQIMTLPTPRARVNFLKKNPNLKVTIPNSFGLLVREAENLPAGLKSWDQIIAINGEPINNSLEFSDELIKYKVGEEIIIMVIRNKRNITLEVTLKELEIPVDKIYDNKTTAPKKDE